MSSKAKKKRKYKTITLKLTDGQYKSLAMYCNALKITPVKYIKRSISRYLHFKSQYGNTANPTLPNQLNLFEE